MQNYQKISNYLIDLFCCHFALRWENKLKCGKSYQQSGKKWGKVVESGESLYIFTN
jgi:hypothetical protein